MQFFLGLLTMAVFLLCLATAYYMGRRQSQKPSAPMPVDEEEQQRTKRAEKHFKALFSYDVDTAYGRRLNDE